MNNEEKRFKQINRIAKPIQVTNNENNNQPSMPPKQPDIPPKKEPPKKNIKKLSRETIFIIIIALLGILIVGALIFLIILSTPEIKPNSLKYNDATTTTTNKKEEYFISYEMLSEVAKINTAGSHNLRNFNFTLSNNGTLLNISINGKFITSANYLINKIGFVDDLVMFTTQNNDVRSTTFYVVDTKGNIILNIHNYEDIDGMVLTDNDAVNYDPTSIILSFTRVNNNLIYNSNTIGNNTSANICSEDDLFANSIETEKSVKINYTLEYLGNHTFSKPSIIYEESLEDYKTSNNLCH